MIWMDVRSARQADAIAATEDPALRVNGAGAGPVSAEWMIPKSLWIKENQRELFDRAEKIGEFQDYLNLRLTGRWVGSLNNMSVRWHYQSDHGGRPVSLLRTLGLEDLLDKWPKEVIAPGRCYWAADERRRRASGPQGRHTCRAGRCRCLHRNGRAWRHRAR